MKAETAFLTQNPKETQRAPKGENGNLQRLPLERAKTQRMPSLSKDCHYVSLRARGLCEGVEP